MSSSTSTRKRRRREAHAEEHPDERWLVSYADMITVLMILFIVMFAMSQVDANKFTALKESLRAGFGHGDSLLQGAESLLPESGTTAATSTMGERSGMAGTSAGLTAEQQAAVEARVTELSQLQAGRAAAEGEAELNRLLEVLGRIDAALRAKGLRDDVVATIDKRGLVLSLVSRHVIFELGKADLTTRGTMILDTIAPLLAELPDPLEIDGHTNQQKFKISDELARSEANWGLASDRAITVLNYLFITKGIPETRMMTAAFGDTKPLLNPTKPGAQEVNKRVDLVVLTQLPDTSRAALEEAASRYTAANPDILNIAAR